MTTVSSVGKESENDCRPAATVGCSAQTATDIICGADVPPMAGTVRPEMLECTHVSLDTLLKRMDIARAWLLALKAP